MEPIWIGCPESNFRAGRPPGFRPEAIVIHIMDGSFAAGESVFSDASTQKSAHYGISKTGVVHQYVDEADTAFHAGIVVNPVWPLLKPGKNPNFYTIGIEHEGRPDDVWPDIQLATSAALVGEIAKRWSIPLDTLHVIPHHQIRSSKTCPGNVLTDMGTILRLVPANALAVQPAVTTLRLLKDANLRIGEPGTHAKIARVLSANTRIAVAAFEMGERVDGNPFWYVDADGHFLWAGTTDVPSPVGRA